MFLNQDSETDKKRNTEKYISRSDGMFLPTCYHLYSTKTIIFRNMVLTCSNITRSRFLYTYFSLRTLKVTEISLFEEKQVNNYKLEINYTTTVPLFMARIWGGGRGTMSFPSLPAIMLVKIPRLMIFQVMQYFACIYL